MTRFMDRIARAEAKTISVIGLAKNTGKTVTLNTLAEEAYGSGLKTALVSFGRDGEAVDAITRLDKPRIRVFPGSLFVTSERFLNPAVVDVEDKTGTGITSVFGEACIYTAGPSGGLVELIGINTVSSLKNITSVLENQVDLVLIDGALDRRSSALPVFSDACIISTGAVLGKDEKAVIKRTEEAITKLRLPGTDDHSLNETARSLYGLHQNGIVFPGNEVVQKEEGAEAVIACAADTSARALILRGALTDRLAEPLLHRKNRDELIILLKDATRLFLSYRYMTMLKNRHVVLRVLDPVHILALTVNPTRPFGAAMDSAYLLSAFRETYPELLCCNVRTD